MYWTLLLVLAGDFSKHQLDFPTTTTSRMRWQVPDFIRDHQWNPG